MILIHVVSLQAKLGIKGHISGQFAQNALEKSFYFAISTPSISIKTCEISTELQNIVNAKSCAICTKYRNIV